MTPYYEQSGVTIYHGDCRDVLPSLSGVHLVAADPPYNGVVADAWDNQWPDDASFLQWLGDTLSQCDAAMTDNATLYVFASPRLSARVEWAVSQRFAVIGNTVWDKGDGRKGASGSGVDVTALRTYWSSDTERVIIGEKMMDNYAYRSADDQAKEAPGFWTAREEGKRSVFSVYLRAEFDRANVTNREVAALFPSRSGGLTGCVSNWLLGINMRPEHEGHPRIPTAEQYQAIRLYLNGRGSGADYLCREYDDLRRPFYLKPTNQWGSVWRFPIERDRDHPTQKPLSLMMQIIGVSSRPLDLVLDPFMGSGTTLVAAKRLERKAIGIEREEKYCEIAAKRLQQEALPLEMGALNG